MKQQQQGFTLIELVTVIVILGILAAFALPRFSGLESQARVAAIQGLAGSVRSASALAHSLQIANGSSAGINVSMEGQAVTMANGYPTANDGGIRAALQDDSEFSFDGAGTWSRSDAATPGNCSVQYINNPAPNSLSVNVLPGGC